MRVNEYIVTFNNGCTESIKLNVVQNINRPNNSDDDYLIRDYLFEEYGYTNNWEYEIIELEDIATIDI